MWKNVLALCLVALMLPAAVARDNDPDPEPRVKPREIVVRGLPRGQLAYSQPLSIPSEKHLAEVVPNAQTRAAILKQVDFRKERLLLFTWSGSGIARIIPTPGKCGEATFDFKYGGSKDDVSHAKLFAIPARAKVKVTAR